MSLYRLDTTTGEPIRDPLIGGDYLTTSAFRARSFARQVALARGQDIIVTRIYGAGLMKRHYVARAV